MEENLFKKKLVEIIFQYTKTDDCKADEIIRLFGDFQHWKDNPHKCPFTTCYNGTDKDRPKIEYERLNKHYTVEDVMDYYVKNILK